MPRSSVGWLLAPLCLFATGLAPSGFGPLSRSLGVGPIAASASPLLADSARGAPQGKETVFVQVQSTSLRATPQHWARSVAEMRYGDRLTLLDSVSKETTAGVPGWLKVQKSGAQGFVHISAVTSRTVVIQGKAGGTGSNLSSGDIVLAGKGFNADVERSYAGKKSGANFSEVDRMEARKVSNGEVASFINAGRLGQNGGKS